MKTAIKLTLIYFAMQILAALAVLPLCTLYVHITGGSAEQASELSIAPMLVLAMLFMALYLWKTGYLTGDRRLYSPLSAACLGWSAALGIAMIYLVDFLMSYLTFLPNWMEQTFTVLQSGWLGIVAVAVLGPILEELLFRGAITKVLLMRYCPATAILLSGLIFGIFHINPVQVVGATLIGFVLAWLYYRTRSLMPCILIHILNNSLSVYLSLNYPDAVSVRELMGSQTYVLGLVAAVLLFVLSWRMMHAYKPFDTTTES